MSKRRRRKPRPPKEKKDVIDALLQELREARDTHEFTYKSGTAVFIVTAEQYLPGTAMMKRRTSLIKLYETIDAESVPEEEVTSETLKAQAAAQDEKIAQINEDFCDRVIDIRRERDPKKSLEEMKAQQKLSVKHAQELFPVRFKTAVIDWAMGGATPPDPKNPTEEDAFPKTHPEPGA